MQLPLYDAKGTKLNKKVTLDSEVFGSKINMILVRQSLHVYSMNQRQATAHTKIRSEVHGGGAKPWAQKGTGRARHGSIRSPIWKGGGVVFGPRSSRNYKRKLTKKMRKAAMRSVLSYVAEEKRLIILEKIDIKDKHLTRQVLDIIEKLPVDGKILFIQGGEHKNLYFGCRNLEKINVINVFETNVYDILNHDYIVVFQNVLDTMSTFWGKKEKVLEKKKDEIQKKDTLKEMSELPTRVKTILDKQGLKTKEQIVSAVKKGKKIEGIGQKSIEEIKKVYNIS